MRLIWKNVNNKNWSLSFIFFNEKKIRWFELGQKYIAIFPSLSKILHLTKMSKKNSIQFLIRLFNKIQFEKFFLSNFDEMNEQTYPLLGLILWLESWRLIISKNVLMLSKRTSGLSRPSTRQAEITRYWKKNVKSKWE